MVYVILVLVLVLFLMSFIKKSCIGSCELEDIDVSIQLANRETISSIAIVVYAILVLVQVIFLMSFIRKSCMKLVLVNLKILM